MTISPEKVETRVTNEIRMNAECGLRMTTIVILKGR